MYQEKNDFILKAVIIIMVTILHLIPFLTTGPKLSISGDEESLGGSPDSGSKKNVLNRYNDKFANKEYKLILTQVEDVNAQFIKKIVEPLPQVVPEKKVIEEPKEKPKEIIKEKTKKEPKPKSDEKKTSSKEKIENFTDSTEGSGSASGAGSGTGSDAGSASGAGAGKGMGVGAGSGSGGGSDSGASHIGGHLKNPKPPYPRLSVENGEEGSVGLEVMVEADGSPSSVKVVQSSGFPRLDKSALQTVKNKYRFIPTKRLGIPVRAKYNFSIVFELKNE